MERRDGTASFDSSNQVSICATENTNGVGDSDILQPGTMVANRCVASASRPSVALEFENRKLSPVDFAKILDWLEIPDNFAMLHGTKSRLAIGEKHPAKKTVFAIMLVVLHSHGFPKFVKNGNNLGKRFGRYMAKWKEALAMKRGSGNGLTMHELRMGVTLDEKYEKICPHFQRMCTLYTERDNVDPPSLASVGIPGIPELYQDARDDHTSEDDRTELLIDDSQRDLDLESLFDDEANTRLDSEENVTEIAQDGNEAGGAQTEYEATEQNTADTFTPGNVEEQATRTPVRAPRSPAIDAPTPSTNGPNASRRTPNKRGASSQVTSMTNIADLYLDKINDKSIYRQELIQTKDKWRTEELLDRREARMQAAREAQNAARILRTHETKRVRLEHKYQCELIQAQQRTTLLTELFKSNRSQQEMVSLMTLIDPTMPPSNSGE